MDVKDGLLRKRILLLRSAGLVKSNDVLAGLYLLSNRFYTSDISSDLSEKEKKEHTATALTLLGEKKTNEEKELLSGLQEENQKNLEEKSSLIGSKRRHRQLPVFSSSVKLESQPGRGRFLVAATNICPGKRIFCIFVFVFLCLYFCVCTFVFVFCVCTFVFVFGIWFLEAATNICTEKWICLLLSGALSC